MEGSTIKLCPRTALVYRTNPSVTERCLRNVCPLDTAGWVVIVAIAHSREN
jgi:hypothetical protein